MKIQGEVLSAERVVSAEKTRPAGLGAGTSRNGRVQNDVRLSRAETQYRVATALALARDYKALGWR